MSCEFLPCKVTVNICELLGVSVNVLTDAPYVELQRVFPSLDSPLDQKCLVSSFVLDAYLPQWRSQLYALCT
jgi:hypothetical protein